jgi:CRISPR-associated protein Cmr6
MIPDWQATLLDDAKGVNYSLYFTRMTTWRENRGDLKAEYLARVVKTKKGDKEEYAPDIERLGEKSLDILPAASTVLNAIHTRQTAVLKTEAVRGGMVWEFRARLLSPYVSGLGSSHPTETGMILDRNSGLPYIPASTIKGVLRLACALHIAETEPSAAAPCEKDISQMEIPDDHPVLRRYFGDTNTGKSDGVRGQLAFLDAFPAVAGPIIKTDIMNPHFGKYYSREQGPLETENPIPVKFLAVRGSTEFVFRCFSSPLPSEENVELDSRVYRHFGAEDNKAVVAMFARAFNQLGFGGKTSIGYGRFDQPSIRDTAAFLKMIEKDLEDKEKQELLNKQEEENCKFPWRKSLRELGEIADWGMLRQKALDNKDINTHKSKPEVGAAIKEIALKVRKKNARKWDAERDQFIAEWLAASETTWESASQPVDGEPPSSLAVDEQLTVDRIKALKDWGQWKNANLKISDLPLAAAEELSKLFSTLKIDKSKNKEKKKVARELRSHLRALRANL